MPNADSSEMTRLKRLKAQANDSNGNVAVVKFRRPSPDGILPVQIKYSLSNFLPGIDSVHSIAAAQRVSSRRPIGFPPAVIDSPLVWNGIPPNSFAYNGGGNDVKYGNGYWVAVGGDTYNHVVWSANSINWTLASGLITRASTNSRGISVTYGSGKWVVIGYDGSGIPKIWHTTNPSVPWTPVANEVFVDTVEAYPNGIATDGNGNWVIVGNTPVPSNRSVFFSSNLVNWVSATSQTVAEVFFAGYGNSVAHGNGLWVTVGSGGADNNLYWSSDGRDWTNVAGVFDGGQGKKVVTDGYGNWVAVGTGGNNLCWSRDGKNWTNVSGIFPGGQGSSVATDGYGNWVAVGNGGDDNNLYWSRNLSDWTPVAGVFNGGAGSSVSYGNGLWIVTGAGTDGTTYSSKNLTTWTLIPEIFAAGGRGRAVAYGNENWVIVGQGNDGSNLFYGHR